MKSNNTFCLRGATDLIVLLLLTCQCGFSQINSKVSKIDSLMIWSKKIGLFNGNVLVVNNDSVIYQNSFGYSDASRKNKLTSEYRFNIGSITKELSAVAVMQLSERGMLNLDDRISKFIPTLPKWAAKISVKNLLQYTSGLPSLHWENIQNDRDAMSDLMKIDSLKFEPGTGYYYETGNVVLRQFIVEKLTGLSFNEYAETNLLKPANMKNSLMNPLGSVEQIAKSFADESVNSDPTETETSGVVFVTANDLYQWAKNLHEFKMISKNSLLELGLSFGAQSSLGFVTFDHSEMIIHQHSGEAGNFEAFMYIDLTKGFTIILLCNNKHQKLIPMIRAIRSILKNEPHRLPKKSVSRYLDGYADRMNGPSLIKLYYELQRTNGSEFDFESEEELNSLGYNLLNKKKVDDAIMIFSLNTQLFPNSGNVFDSLGDAYQTKGDYKNALFYYQKSLEINPNNENAKRMINLIKKN